MSDCKKYAEKINAYIDGALPAAEIAELLSHIERCPDCAKRFESLKIIAFEMRHMQVDIPADLHSSIMAQIKDAKRPSKRAYTRIFATVAAAAAMTVFLIRGDMFDLNKIYIFGDGASRPSEQITSDSDPGDAAPYVRQTPAQIEPPAVEAPEAKPQAPAAQGPITIPAPRAVPAPSEPEPPPAQKDANVIINDLDPGAELELRQFGLSEKTEIDPAKPFRVTKLITDEAFGFFCVAVGSGEIPEQFPQASVVGEVGREPVYVYVKNTSAAHKEAEAALVGAGFAIMRAPTNLPQTDSDAEFGLVIIIWQ